MVGNAKAGEDLPHKDVMDLGTEVRPQIYVALVFHSVVLLTLLSTCCYGCFKLIYVTSFLVTESKLRNKNLT